MVIALDYGILSLFLFCDFNLVLWFDTDNGLITIIVSVGMTVKASIFLSSDH